MRLSDLSKSQLGAVQERFAIASNVYEDDKTEHRLSGGWQRIFTSSEVPGLNDRGFYGALYKRTISGKDEHIFAFRGMDGIKDLDDVTLLALGKAPGQVSDAYRFVKMAAEKFDFDPAGVEYVGHSLGGYLSKAIGMLHGARRVTAFNSPGLFYDDLEGLPARIRKEFGDNKAVITARQVQDGVLSINSKFDFVTWAGDLSGHTIKVNTQGAQHRLSSLESSFNRAALGLDRPATAYKPQPVLGLAFG